MFEAVGVHMVYKYVVLKADITVNPNLFLIV